MAKVFKDAQSTSVGNAGQMFYFKNMKQVITGYHQDEQQDWVAELACGHYQHIRHNPPWTQRPWVVTSQGRASKLGYQLECRECDQGEPKDSFTA